MLEKLRSFLKDEERLALYVPGYEFRASQFEMASAVLKAFIDGGVLFVEAPSGTGKSLAYLSAAAVFSAETRRKVVISTYTKTLQNQLFHKDLPILIKLTGEPLKYALCIGSSNYLCRARFNVAVKSGLLSKDEKMREQLLEWAQRTSSGLLSDTDFSVPREVRERISRQRQICSGNKCPYWNSCYFTKARRRVKQADVIVANHWMFFTDLARGCDILPSEYALVLDEAHTAEPVARDKFSEEFSTMAVERYISDLKAHMDQPGSDSLFSDLRDVTSALKEAVSTLTDKLDDFLYSMEKEGSFEEKSVFDKKKCAPGEVYSVMELIAQLLSDIVSAEDDDTQQDLSPRILLSRTVEFMRLMKEIFWEDRPDRVYWRERRVFGKRRAYKFHSTLLDVSSELRERLYVPGYGRVLTSATITTGTGSEDPFDYIKRSLGAEDPRTLRLAEVFDHSNKVYFCVPKGIPDPGRDISGYRKAVVDNIIEAYDRIDGGIFALFTSYKMMNYCADRLSTERDDMNLLKQGDLPRYVLLDVFKSRREKTLLLGTASFWQGVDVAGDALKGVIITRLPFSVPTEPVTRMRIERINRSGGNAFRDLQLPESLVMFKQGFGRLIRGPNDTGVVIVLDPRVRTKSYGKNFLEVLPKMRVRTDLDGISSFFEKPPI